MIRRLIPISLIVLTIALVSAISALAGGWAAITLDGLPSGIRAGETNRVGFIVRQHGITPMEGLTPTVHFSNRETKEAFSAAAMEEGEAGHYAVEFSLPSSGTWEWGIEAFTMSQPMPDLQVLPAAAQGYVEKPDLQPLPLVAGIAGLVAAGISLAIVLSRRVRWVLALVFLGLLVSGMGFYGASARPAVVTNPEADSPSSSSIEQGEALFVAKGCTTCHLNGRIDRRYTVFSTEIGPDLTEYSTEFKTSLEYLRLWLSDPAGVRPDTKMPNLELSEAEIEALAAFLLEQQAQQ